MSAEEQSHCHSAGVRRPSPGVRPSVNPVLSETVMQINAKFGGKLPIQHISRPFRLIVGFQNFTNLFIHLFILFYTFSLT